MSQVRIHRASDETSAAAEPQRLRVAIADDHANYRDRLAIFLRERDLEVVGEVGNGEAAIELCERAAPDVIVIDLRMPLLSGFEAIRRLGRVVPRHRIVAIGAVALADEIADAILLGANGHVSKDRPLPELIWMLRAVAAGKLLIGPGTAQVLLRRLRGEADPERSLADASVSRRELDLLACLAQSYTPAQIAIALSATSEEVVEDAEVLLMKLRLERRIKEGPDV